MQSTTDKKIDSISAKKRFLHNISSGWLAVTTNALVGVFILPINLYYLGKEVYGISVLATSLLLILHYLGFGMGPTLVRFFSQAIADGDDERFCKISSTAQLFTGTCGILGAVIFMCCFPWFCDKYNISPELKTSTFILFCSMAFAFLELFYRTTFSTILQSYQHLDVLNYIRSIAVVLRVVLLVVFYKFVSPSLASLGIVIFLIATLRLAIIFLFTLKYGGSKIIFSIRSIDIGLAPKLFAFSALVFLNNISMGLSVQLPSLVIGVYLGKTAVSDFSPALTVTSFVGSILSVIAAPLPPLACIEARKGGERLGAWAMSIGQVVACVGYCAVLVIWLFGNDWITVWLGSGYAWTSFIVTIMATASVLASIQLTSYTIALGASTITPVAWSSLVMAITIFGGTWIGLHYHLFEFVPSFHFDTHPSNGTSLLGVAWLIFFVRVARNVFFLPSVYSKKFNYGYWTYFFKVYLVPFVVMCAVALFWIFTLGKLDFAYLQGYLQDRFQAGRLTILESRLPLICVTGLKSAIVSVLFLAICWFGILPVELKRSLYQTLRRKQK